MKSKNLISTNKEVILVTILVLSILVKFINISMPIFEGYIGRQIATANMTRNIYKGGSIFYPEIDSAPFPHYVMLEFPIYNIIIDGFYKVFGENEVWGRFVSLLCIIFATVFLFKIVKRYFNFDVAILSCIFFNLSPISLIYARAYQPDPMMLFSILAGLYFLDCWIDNQKNKYLLTSAVFFSIAFIIKIIALYVFLPIIFLFWYKNGKRFLCKPDFWFFAVICLVPSLIWYLHARAVALSPEIYRESTVWNIFKVWIVPSYWTKISFYKIFFKNFLGLLLTPIGVVFFFLGILRRNLNKRQLFFHVYMISLLIYSFLLFKKMDLEYYYFAYLPVVSVFVARGVEIFINNSFFKREFYVNKLSFLGIILVCLAFIFGYGHRGFVVPHYLEDVQEVVDVVKAKTDTDDLVITSIPILYYADRRGFIFDYEKKDIKEREYRWKTKFESNSPKELLNFYINKGGVVFADTLNGKEEKYNEFFGYLKKKFKNIEYEPGKYIFCRVSGE